MLFLSEVQDAGIMLSWVRTILMDISTVIYKLIIYVYELFVAIGGATLLTSDKIQIIYNRVGLILGIVMMFRLIFTFIQYMLDPDKMTDKQEGVGNIIKKVLIVIVALGSTEWIFTKALEFQELVLEDNTVGKIVLGQSAVNDQSIEDFGTTFSYSLFNNFYYLSPDLNGGGEEAAETHGCGPEFFSATLPKYVSEFKDFELAHSCLNNSGTVDGGEFPLSGNKVYYSTFNGLEAILFGGVALYALLMYTISLAIRVVKLAFLRIIAPIPILSHLSPKKDTAFQKWLKQCGITYLDLFIRLGIMYFAVLLIGVIMPPPEDATGFYLYTDNTISEKVMSFGKIIFVLGVLLFVKKIPDYIGEIFPSMGKGGLDLGLGLKSRTDFFGKGALKRTAGAALGGAAIGALGAAQGFVRKAKGGEKAPTKGKRALNTGLGFLTGTARGIYNGAHGGKMLGNLDKAFKSQVNASESTNKFITAGYDSILDRAAYSVTKKLGFPTKYDEILARGTNLENKAKEHEDLAKTFEGISSSKKNLYDTQEEKIANNDDKTKLTKEEAKHSFEHLKNKGWVNENGELIYTVNGKRVSNEVGPKLFDGNLTVGLVDDAMSTELSKTRSRIDNATKIIDEENNKKNSYNIQLGRRSDLANKNELTSEERKELDALNLQISDLESKVANCDSTIKFYEDQRRNDEQIVLALNINNFRKDLRDAALSEVVFGNSAEGKLKDQLADYAQDIGNTVANARIKIEKMRKENDQEYTVQVQEYSSAVETLDGLNKILTAFRNNNEFYNSNPKQVELSLKYAFDQLQPDEMAEFDLSKFASNLGVSSDNLDDTLSCVRDVIDFDRLSSDGEHHVTKKLGIANVSDLLSEIEKYSKKSKGNINTTATNIRRERAEIMETAEALRAQFFNDNIKG